MRPAGNVLIGSSRGWDNVCLLYINGSPVRSILMLSILRGVAPLLRFRMSRSSKARGDRKIRFAP